MKKRLLSIITAFIMVCSFVGVVPKLEMKVEAAGNLEVAVQWAINKANDNSCGYSQSNRWGPTYYDCSSFVITALKNGGFDVGSATYTQNMRSNLTTRGFTWITWSSIGGSGNLKRGDILLNDSSDPSKQHTEFYIGNNQNVGAHTSKRAWNDQVSVSGYYNHPWTGVLRYNGTVPNPVLPGTVDTSYATPWKGEPIATSGLITVYNNYATAYSTSVRNIAHNDWCTIHEVYTNGFCKVTYPISGGTHTEYAKASDFNIPKKDLPGKTNVYCDIGTEYYPTIFSWDKVSNATDYDLKIWKGTLWQGDAYTIIWNIKETNYGVNLPAGYYEAYIDSRNASGINMSNNVVKFTVGNATPVDLGTNFYAYITNSSSKKPLTNDGNNVSIRTKTGNSNQIWKFVRQSDKSYKIINCKDNNVLDVYCSGTTDGTNVQTWVSNDCNAQRWFVYEKSGTYYLRAKCGALVLDVNGGLSADGTNVQMWTSNSTSAQKFKIEKTNCPHSFGSWTTSKAATCTAEGSKTRKCSICGKTETGTIAKTAHKYTSKVIAPTCTSKGYTKYTCSCGNSYTDTETAAKGHKFTSKTANGNTTYTCSSCKYSYKVTFEGKGTAESPYLIANKEDLYCLAGLINNTQTADFFRTKCYKQTADIDLKNEKWTPIGKFKIDGKETGCYFSSGFVYDGANHSIFNMNVNEASGYTGFIGKVNFGTVKNLAVYGNVSSTSESGEGTAGIVGEVGYMGKVLNCSFNGNVSSDESSGGIVGHVWRGATIENCYHNGTVTGGKWAGGIVGLALDKNYESEIHTNIKNCYHLGKVTGPESGGIVGKHAETGTLNEKNTLNIINSYFLSSSATKGLGVGTITKNESTAIDSDSLKSLARKLGGTYRDNSHPKLNDGYPVFEWQFESTGHKYTSKVVVPTCTAKGYTEYTCSACKHTYTDTEKAALGHKFTSKTENGTITYTCSACKLSYKVTFEGNGTADSPYLIENKEDLFCLANLINNVNTASFFRTKCYKQTANIDLDNEQWVPLGTYIVNDKSGNCYLDKGFVYDGANHSVFNLNVNESSSYSGFIGKMNYGTVKNLAIYGDVKSTGSLVGGIVGELGYMGTIENCSFNGNVSGKDLVGGIVGHCWQGSNILNCYHNGNITSEKNAGGIAGFIQHKDSETELHSNISNCYHIGDISGTTVGGVVGKYSQSGTLNENNSVNIKNCYFLKSSAENGLGEGKITKNDSTPLISGMLKEIAVDLGSSFGSNKHAAINNGYPAFKWQLPSKVKGDINNDGKLQIADAVKVQKALSKVQIVTAADAIASDVNEDGKFNVFDLIIVKRMLLNS